jgi:hypothetical protein
MKSRLYAVLVPECLKCKYYTTTDLVPKCLHRVDGDEPRNIPDECLRKGTFPEWCPLPPIGTLEYLQLIQKRW